MTYRPRQYHKPKSVGRNIAEYATLIGVSAAFIYCVANQGESVKQTIQQTRQTNTIENVVTE